MANRIIGQLYGIDDFVIIPEIVSNIRSRTAECNPRYSNRTDIFNNMLPLFTAPMSCVVNEINWKEFKDNGVLSIIPRTVDFETRCELIHDTFIAVGVKEFETLLTYKHLFNVVSYVCVDVANGHMSNMIKLCAKAKELYDDNIVLMAGNIANPDTYYEYARAGIDLVRLSVGSGNVCTTASNTGVHYPLGSLIYECNERRNDVLCANDLSAYRSAPRLIADGGFNNFDQIIKAYALGADFCMLGKMLAQTFTACGKLYSVADGGMTNERGDWMPIDEEKTIQNFAGMILSSRCYREYYGMSTKKAQMEMGKTEDECRTAEGIIKYVLVKETLSHWLDNFMHYLKSSMSYCNCNTIEEFIGFPKMGINTPMARSAFAK